METENTFEMSLRVLGNEVLGFKIVVDDFKTKWVVISIMAVVGLASALSIISPVIDNFK
jgi:hypothetical protein